MCLIKMPIPALIITVEGNIGAGKSTILKKIRQRVKRCNCVAIISEPAEEWMERQYLQKMYSNRIDPCTFQMAVLTSLTSRLMTKLQRDSRPLVLITERSPFTNLDIFAKWKLQNDQLDIYKYAWTDVTEMLFAANVMVRHVVLLGDSARTMQRIRSRNRACEQCLDLTEVEALEARHRLWMSELEPEIVASVSHEDDADVVASNVCEAMARFIRDASAQFPEHVREQLNATRTLLNAPSKF